MKNIKSKRWLVFLALGILLLVAVNDDFISYSNIIVGFSGVALILLGLQELNERNKKR